MHTHHTCGDRWQAYPLWASIMAESGVSFFQWGAAAQMHASTRHRHTGGLNVGLRGAKMDEIIAHARAVGAPIEVIDNTQIQQRYGCAFLHVAGSCAQD